jgi:phage gpG-like protein
VAEGVRLEVTFDDLPAREGVASLLASAADLRPMMTIAGGIFENSTRNRFDTGRGPSGIPWPESWRARVDGGKTLVDKGLLRGSIISNVGANFVETGVDGRNVSSKYARTHQFGATIRAKTAKGLAFVGPDGKFYMRQQVRIPARPFLGVDGEDLQDLLEAFVDYLEGAANG